MKIFKSLNCSLCEAPFVRDAKAPRSPRKLRCGLAMCHECFEKEKAMKREERKHQCERGDDCFSNLNFAYFLIDVLSQNSLILSPIGFGYLLREPFKVPECPICQDEYSNKLAGKKALVLYCNHMICNECYLKHRLPYKEEILQKWKHGIKCPFCTEVTVSNGDQWKDVFDDFLDELPEMTRQLKEMQSTKYRFCEECMKLNTIDEMFHCNECTIKLCAFCMYKNHHSHKAMPLLQKEVNEIVDDLQAQSINQVETYKPLFGGLHTELFEHIDAFETKLLSKKQTLKNVDDFDDLKKKQEKWTKSNNNFENVCETYMPALRKCVEEVKTLTQDIDKDWGQSD